MMKKTIDKIFSMSKLRSDFYDWLNEDYSNHNEIEIGRFENPDETRIISISPKESLNLYRIRIRYDIYDGLWYTVYLAIGNFIEPDECRITEIEKGVVKLCYNDDLSLYDAELFFDDLY